MNVANHRSPATVNRLIVGIMSALLLWGATAVPAQAQTPDAAEMQATIQSLLEQIATLQNQLSVADTGSAAGIDPDTFTRNLSRGDQGLDVRSLQRFLNQDPDTQVASSGPGSPGNETAYFGPATAAAVARFQELHRDDILEPLDLVNGTGFFGLGTRERVRELLLDRIVPPMDPDGTLSVQTEGLTVVASFTANNGCPNYGIDWGDGSKISRVAEPGLSCTQALQEVEESHTYDAAGTYEVTLRYRDERYVATVQVRDSETGSDNATVTITEVADRSVTIDVHIDQEEEVASACGPIVVGSVNWGDDTDEPVTMLGCSSQDSAELTHEYVTHGQYTIVVQAWDGTEDRVSVDVGVAVEEYEVTDVRSVSTEAVDPLPQAIDDEYTRYTITLRDGTVHTVRRYAFAPQGAFLETVQETGYVGDLDDLLDLADREGGA